jgi:protein-L-isoaspartate(D-aspartate) O-methyltransferase
MVLHPRRIAVALLVSAALAAGCAERAPVAPEERAETRPAESSAPVDDRLDERLDERHRMVRNQIAARGVSDERVLAAMRKVPRHRYVPAEERGRAYRDHPLPIGLDQTISQPYIVAFMSEALRLEGHEKVLEIGTGSGYQAAILAELAAKVYSIEIVAPLAERAARTLRAEGYDRIHLRTGDGYRGWPEAAPFDAIMVTAAPDHVPEPLVEQLAVGGRLLLPVGDLYQQLVILEKTEAGLQRRTLAPVRFVPMTGEAERR